MDLLQGGIIHFHIVCNAHLREVSTGLAQSSGLSGSGVAKAKDPGLYGVELLDAGPEVSRTAWDRNLLTSMVMLIWPSTLGGGPW